MIRLEHRIFGERTVFSLLILLGPFTEKTAIRILLAIAKFLSVTLTGKEGLTEMHNEEDELAHDASSSVGMALTCGFIFMLLVDQIGGAHGGHSHGHNPG